jgi:hypothetical protein
VTVTRRLLPQPVGDEVPVALPVGVLLGEVDVALGEGGAEVVVDGVSDVLGLEVAVGDPEVLGLCDGLGVEDFAGSPRTGPMMFGPCTCTLPGAVSVSTAAAATPASARPPAAAVTRRAFPARRNSVLRRARSAGGRAARCAARELSGALR